MKKQVHSWKWFFDAGKGQVLLRNGEDIKALFSLDQKYFSALSMPLSGVRIDRRTLELIDTDGDGRIRVNELLAALEFLRAQGISFDSLFSFSDENAAQLATVLSQTADLAAAAPAPADIAALEDWTKAGESDTVKVLGDDTAAAYAAFDAVSGVIDAYFLPAGDLPLVVDEIEPALPLYERISPRYAEEIELFADQCVKRLIGERRELSRREWKRIKASMVPYRQWLDSRPVANAAAKAELEKQERTLRYQRDLLEVIENFVSFRRLYDCHSRAAFELGTLSIDGKELDLCLNVDNEAAHSELSVRSECCVVYFRISGVESGNACAVVTAGKIRRFYPGRRGIFHSRDGHDLEAVVTKVVENEVSLVEAFFSPWRKLGEGIAAMTKKFFGSRQQQAMSKVDASLSSPPPNAASTASGIAAIGIGMGMVGTAVAALAAAIRGMSALQFTLVVIGVVLAVSIPSVILSYFKLRRRDLGAVLNASGWAINIPLGFSQRTAKRFTRVR